MRRPLALALLGLIVLVPAAARAPVGHAAGSCQAGDTMISIVEYAFQGGTITIPAGTTVCWTNKGTVDHSASSNSPAFNSMTLAPGDSYRFTFSADGSFPYRCTFHSGMTGSVVVQ